MDEQVIDLRFRSFHEEEADGSHTVIVKISGLPSMAYANKASDWMRALIREHVDLLGSIEPNPPPRVDQ